MKNISILINSLAANGGAEKQCFYISDNLPIKNIYLLNNINAYKSLNDKITLLLNKKRSRFQQLIIGIYSLSNKVNNNDTIISFMELSNFINIIVKILFNKHKCIVSVRISPSYYDNIKYGAIIKFLIRLLYPHADLIVANSKDCLEHLKKIINVPKSNFIYIPNTIDLKKIKNIKSIPILPDDYLITIGRLHDQKNIDFQIKVFSQLKEMGKNYKHIIIGDGPLKQMLIENTKNKGLNIGYDLSEKKSDIFFLGHQNNPYKYINKKSVFLLSSNYEGMPNVIIEAMSRGAVIVSSNCPTGPRELITNDELFNKKIVKYKFGFLLSVPSNSQKDINLWSNTLIEIMEDKSLRDSYSNYSILRSKDFSFEKVISQWRNIIIN